MKTITSKKTWKNTSDHFIKAINSEWYKEIGKIMNEFVHATYRFFEQEHAMTVCLPVTSTSCTSPMGLGSDSLPVKVDLCGVSTYLADSMQFHLEYMMRVLENNVHYLMPSFRGEKADARHLCQFYHSEAEIFGELDDVIDIVGRYIHYLCMELLKHCKDGIIKIAGTTEHVEKLIAFNGNFPSISLYDAIKELNNDPHYVEYNEHGFAMITNAGEQKLIDLFDGVVWLTHHEWISVPFYQARYKNTKYACNADLLLGIGEVVGAGERCENVKEIRESLKYHNVSEDEYKWYVQMKNLYPAKTSGFGLGVERFLLFLLRHNDIRDIQTILRFNGENICP